MHSIVILNGPNLNLLGTREPGIYGAETLDSIRARCTEAASSLSISVDLRQSNHEGELIDWIQDAGRTADGLILNPAGLGHTSIAMMDALLAIAIPTIEVHLSNIHKREEFRQHTYTSRAVRGIISGLGGTGYVLAIRALAEWFEQGESHIL
jgi:3-dehydroquinate dehydratase-2